MTLMVDLQNRQLRFLVSRGPALTTEAASRLAKVVAFEELSLVILNVLWPVALVAHIYVFLLYSLKH